MKDVSDAQAELPELIDAALHGNLVIITQAGSPIAKLVVCRRSVISRSPGALKGKIKIAPDFDSMPDEWNGWI